MLLLQSPKRPVAGPPTELTLDERLSRAGCPYCAWGCFADLSGEDVELCRKRWLLAAEVADRMIAAQALVHRATLVTFNPDDFSDVPGLSALVWSSNLLAKRDKGGRRLITPLAINSALQRRELK